MEIERKFLLKSFPPKAKALEKIIMEQAYISTKPVIRIRKENENFVLTIKGKGLMEREEFELKICEEEYTKLKEKIEYNIIKKTRYIYLIDGIRYEVDEFAGKLSPLLTAEVEFASKEKADSFIPPEWIEKELTMDARFQNANLCQLENIDELF